MLWFSMGLMGCSRIIAPRLSSHFRESLGEYGVHTRAGVAVAVGARKLRIARILAYRLTEFRKSRW